MLCGGLGIALLATACGDDPPPLVLPCDGAIVNVPGEAALHVPIGSTVDWTTNPPATGMHYPVWAKWNRHYTSLDRGFWVHNAEHGGVILLYNCPAGCPDVVTALIDTVRAAADDGSCTAPVRNRMLVAADPQLPAEVQVAAVAWNTIYTASCYDPYVETFARARYNKGLEDVCADGAELGGTPIDP